MQVNHLALGLCSMLELAFAKAQQYSQPANELPTSLKGQVIAIQLRQLNWPIYLLLNSRIQVLSHYEGEANCAVNTDLQHLYSLTEGESLTQLIKQDKLQIEGDLSVLQNFSHYLQHLDVDIIEPLAQIIGDAPAHMFSQQLQRGKHHLQQLGRQTERHFSQLTTQEYRLAPHKLEMINFTDKVELISQDIDALAVRIQQLEHKVNT